MKLTLGYFYNQQLNLYGDDGNVQILKFRAEQRGIQTEVVEIGIREDIEFIKSKNINLVFMGGGPDSGQKDMYEDLLHSKGSFLKDYIENNGFGLFICGSYQLLGNYYKAADGSVLEGLGVFDLYTEHFGNKKSRCIGNVFAEISHELVEDPVFKQVNRLGNTLVGFENHGGRTFLGNNIKPFAHIINGHGNNSVDKTEGCIYKNAIGSYIHGPILSKNPHLADYLIAGALGISLPPLNDDLIIAAHTASKLLKQ